MTAFFFVLKDVLRTFYPEQNLLYDSICSTTDWTTCTISKLSAICKIPKITLPDNFTLRPTL